MPRKTAIWSKVSGAVSGFNEAAARCRGKRLPGGDGRPHGPDRFNEAAARCRGKLGAGHTTRSPSRASMRPRPDAAENQSRRREPAAPGSFNEAAARCRGKRPESRAQAAAGCLLQ